MEGTLEGTEARSGRLATGAILQERYVVVRPLAVGGMARLYLAHHLELGTQVVIKVPDFTSRAMTARLRTEARALARLRHPNVVRALDLCQHQGAPCLVMEHLRGSDLTSALITGPVSPRRALAVLRDVGAALDHVHASGIAHRDVKPANVMLTDAGAVLVDFGLARIDGEPQLDERSTIVGTPEYMAPEQALGLGDHVGPAADRYALAAMALELLSGQRPYPAMPTGKLLLAIAERAPRRPSEIGLTPGLDAVFARALARDPGRRFESAVAMIDAIRRAMRRSSSRDTIPAPEGLPPTVRIRTPLPRAA